MEKFKIELVSFGQTFVSLFLLDLAVAVSNVGIENILSGVVLTNAFFVGLLSGAIRSAAKATWEKYMPVALGGKK